MDAAFAGLDPRLAHLRARLESQFMAGYRQATFAPAPEYAAAAAAARASAPTAPDGSVIIEGTVYPAILHHNVLVPAATVEGRLVPAELVTVVGPGGTTKTLVPTLDNTGEAVLARVTHSRAMSTAVLQAAIDEEKRDKRANIRAGEQYRRKLERGLAATKLPRPIYPPLAHRAHQLEVDRGVAVDEQTPVLALCQAEAGLTKVTSTGTSTPYAMISHWINNGQNTAWSFALTNQPLLVLSGAPPQRTPTKPYALKPAWFRVYGCSDLAAALYGDGYVALKTKRHAGSYRHYNSNLETALMMAIAVESFGTQPTAAQVARLLTIPRVIATTMAETA